MFGVAMLVTLNGSGEQHAWQFKREEIFIQKRMRFPAWRTMKAGVLHPK